MNAQERAARLALAEQHFPGYRLSYANAAAMMRTPEAVTILALPAPELARHASDMEAALAVSAR